jgi:dTDP-4-dehydrorhamnose 3,5-epimerase
MMRAAMRIEETELPGVLVIEPRRFTDDRGFFVETYNQATFSAVIPYTFVQDNLSRSKRGVLRGLHFQEPDPQGKLVRCARGALFDVAVDIRVGSPTFARWAARTLTDEDGLMLWIPPGFAHGFCALTDDAELAYKCTSLYASSADRSVAWNDPDIAIEWPIAAPVLSPKDAAAPLLRDAPVLPSYGA